MSSLWQATDETMWRVAHNRYGDVIAAQGVPSLPPHDAWYQHELPMAMAERTAPHATHAELVRLTEWKMARGEWRARNLVLVRGNAEEEVVRVTREAIALAPHPTRPIALIATLAGVGPATASAVLAASAPSHYPFFDELVAAQVPTLGPVRWTLGYYARYAEALRDRAHTLGDGWTPSMVERALWAHVGGKAGAAG
jgi:hypothetical protein